MLKPIQVLIVENEPALAQTLSRVLALASPGKYCTEVCSCGEAALAQLGEKHYAIVVTDLSMPGMDGLALLGWVRALSPGTRSILMTAYGTPGAESLVSAQADCYLLKPFGLQEFIDTVDCLAEMGCEASQKEE